MFRDTLQMQLWRENMRTDRQALIVGIENYLVLPQAYYAENDANLIEETLREYQFQFSIRKLINKQATSSEILRQFRSMFMESEENAILVFYFAGHASTIDEGTFLITLDQEEDEINPGVHFSRLIEMIKSKRKSGQTCIIILDCCHAGAMEIDGCHINLDSVQNSIVGSSGIALFAATSENDKAHGDLNLQQGSFTNCLFDGLMGGAVDATGAVTIFTLYDYISKAMSINKLQKPIFKTTVFGIPPIIGDGFTPRIQIEVSKLTDAKWLEIITNTKEQILRIKKMCECDQEEWKKSTFIHASGELSALLGWRDELQKSHPELKTKKEYFSSDMEITQIQVQLTNIQEGLLTSFGTVESEIGMGGFGTVYKVKDQSSYLAYKVYHATQLHEKQKLKSFKRGYRAMLKLHHPNIVQVKGYTNAPEGFFMQYIDGPNFRDWWTDDTVQMIDILVIIAQAIDHAHSQGVVHRDIKPENIIIDARDYQKPIPYLTDFDLAWYSTGTVYSTVENPVKVFGHYLYAAPEQYDKPDSEITRKCTTDVYGFGQLCYFSICKSDPARDNASSVSSLQSRLSKWPNGSAANKFMQLYIKSTQKVPSDRYQNMQEICKELLEIKSLLVDPDNTQFITNEEFVKQLTFSLFGFDIPPSKTFTSKSGRTQMYLSTISRNSIQIRFEAILGYTAVTGTFDQQRNTINRRIDEAIGKYGKNGLVKRHAEKIADTFSTTVEISGNNQNLKGVTFCYEVISTVLSCIES